MPVELARRFAAIPLRYPLVAVALAAILVWPQGLSRWHLLWLVPVSLPVAYIVHELGHLLAGFMVGLRVERIALGPLRIDRVGGRRRWHLSWNAWGGTIHSPDLLPGLRHRLLVSAAAGPLVNLVVAFALAAAVALVHPGSLLAASCVTLSAASAGVGLMTLLPQPRVRFHSDGALMKVLFEGDAVGRRHVSLLRLSAWAQEGYRPRDWSTELLEMVREPRDGSEAELAAHVYELWHLMDTGETEEAARRVEESLDIARRVGGRFGRLAHAEAAFLAARDRKDAAGARAHRAEAGDLPASAALRIEAAIRYAEGDAAGALALIRRGIEETGLEDVFELDLLLDLQRRIREEQGASAGTG